MRIETEAFSFTPLEIIQIPKGVRWIDGSAFRGVNLSAIRFENERFVIENAFIIDIIDHKLICNFSNSSQIIIPDDITILGSSTFSSLKSMSSVSFGSHSRLRRIAHHGF
jgi:hypothetical protein